jgi:hypothetical protein
MSRSTNRQVNPEVWFRIVHLSQEGHNGAPATSYRTQMVEIALGNKGAFENGSGSETSTTRSRRPCRRRG